MTYKNELLYFQGLGTDESVLIEILLSRTNAQIEEMKSVYGGKYKNKYKIVSVMLMYGGHCTVN